MRKVELTAFDLAQRYVGIRERMGEDDHPLIRWWHSLTTYGEADDEVPWCSSFVNGVCWELRLPRSKSAAARSWLAVGRAVDLSQAAIGFDVVVLKRGMSPTAGHVGFYAGKAEMDDMNHVQILGGNQGNAVAVAPFPTSAVLGVRRLQD